jgi:hypothetical protein
MILGEATLVGVGAMGLGSVLGLAMTKAVLMMQMVKSLLLEKIRIVVLMI